MADELIAKPGNIQNPAVTARPEIFSPLERYFQQLQEAQQMTGMQRLFGGRRQEGEALRGIKTLAPIAQGAQNAQASMMEQQRNILKYLGDTAKEFHALDPEAKTTTAPFFRSLLKRANDVAGLGLDAATLDATVKSPEFANIVDVYTGKNPLWTDEDKSYLQTLLQSAKTSDDKIKVKDAVEKMVLTRSKATMEEMLPQFVQKIRMAQGIPPDQPVPQAAVIQAFGQQYPNLSRNPMVRQIFAEIRKDDKAMAAAGIATGAAAETLQATMAKESTPGGQATIGLEQARTGEAQARTQEIQAGKVVPFQEGGGIAIVPPGAATPTILQPPGPKPVPLSPTERTAVVEEYAGLERLDRLQKMYAPSFVGPVRGRLGALGATTGNISPQEANFRSQVSEFRNQTIKQISGAAVSASEEKRMTGQLPNVTDQPVVFEAKLKQTRTNLLNLAKHRRTILEKTGANVQGLPALPKSPTDRLGIR